MHHFKVVICNLHHTTILSNISDALVEHGHSVVRVGNIRKKQCPLPLFHVKLALKNNNHDIFNISTLLHYIVVIEKPHSKINDPPQCFKRQAYGHTRNYCCNSPKCIKCGDDHLTADCTKDWSRPAKCALCCSDHTTSYKGCPIHKKLVLQKKKKRKCQNLKGKKLVLVIMATTPKWVQRMSKYLQSNQHTLFLILYLHFRLK
jgi:hypothetical protein